MPKFTPLVEASQFHFEGWQKTAESVEFPLKIQKIQNEMMDADGFSEGPKPFSLGQKLNVCLFQAEFQGHAALRQQSILQAIITWELVEIVCRWDSLLILPRHRIASSEYLPWKSIAFSTKQHDIWIFQSANVHQMPKPSPLSLSLGPQHVRSTPSPAHEASKMRGSVLHPPSVGLHISQWKHQPLKSLNNIYHQKAIWFDFWIFSWPLLMSTSQQNQGTCGRGRSLQSAVWYFLSSFTLAGQCEEISVWFR